MNYLTAILIVLVVVIVYEAAVYFSSTGAADHFGPGKASAAPVVIRAPTIEETANKALRENFVGAAGTAMTIGGTCDPADPATFAEWEYGGKDMDYKDWVTSQGVDDKVIENHLQFVKDKKGLGPGGEFITGRTWSPDSHDSYDPIPWIGIRGRPSAVPQLNPTQVPDLDTSFYLKNRPYPLWT